MLLNWYYATFFEIYSKSLDNKMMMKGILQLRILPSQQLRPAAPYYQEDRAGTAQTAGIGRHIIFKALPVSLVDRRTTRVVGQ